MKILGSPQKKVIKSMIRGSVLMDATTKTFTFPAGVIPANCIMRITGFVINGTSAGSNKKSARMGLYSTNQYRVYIGAVDTITALTVKYEIVEYNDFKSIQVGTTTLEYATINAVEMLKAIEYINHTTTNATTGFYDGVAGIWLENASKLTIECIDANATYYWQIIEHK